MQENAWVGLRPGRTPLRLDSETFPRAVKDSRSDATAEGISELYVVHCYGHGGSGVTLGMGCAEDVVVNHVAPLLRLDEVVRQRKSKGSSSNNNSGAVDGSKLSSWFNIRSRL